MSATLRSILAVASLALRESARSRVLHALIGASLLAFGCSYIFSLVSGGDADLVRHQKIMLDLSLSSITLLGTIAVIFLGTNLIYQEVDRRTIYTILARPISRTGFLIGKYLGLAAVMSVAVAAMGIGFVLIFVLTGGSPTLAIVNALFFVLVELLVVLSVALFFSVAAHPIEGAVFSFVVALAGHVTGSLKDLGAQLLEPVKGVAEPPVVYVLLDKLLYAVYVVFPNLEAFNFKAEATYGIPLEPALLAMALVYAVVYIAIMLAVSSLVFRKRIL